MTAQGDGRGARARRVRPRGAGLLALVVVSAWALFWVGVRAAPSPPAGTAGTPWLASALEDLARGRTESAIGKLRLARWNAPDDPEAPILLAWVHGSRGEWDQAAELVASLPLESMDPSSRLAAQGLLAMAYHATGRLPMAARAYGALLEQAPAAVLALEGLGELALAAARDEQQGARLSQAWPASPAPASSEAWRATAEAHLRDAIARAPDRVDLYVLLASSLMESDRWDEAEELLRQALRVDFRAARVHFSLGQVYEHRGDRQAAISAYRRALEADPSFTPALLRLERLEPSRSDG